MARLHLHGEGALHTPQPLEGEAGDVEGILTEAALEEPTTGAGEAQKLPLEGGLDAPGGGALGEDLRGDELEGVGAGRLLQGHAVGGLDLPAGATDGRVGGEGGAELVHGGEELGLRGARAVHLDQERVGDVEALELLEGPGQRTVRGEQAGEVVREADAAGHQAQHKRDERSEGQAELGAHG